MSLVIQHFFDAVTATFTYVIWDSVTHKSAIIDSVLDYNPDSGHTQTKAIAAVLAYLKKEQLTVEWILETHIHADHLTAAQHLKKMTGGKIGINSNITKILNYWVPIFNTGADTPLTGEQFDRHFADGETFSLGTLTIQVLHTPGHTPACLSYVVEDAAFVGDTLFMPDVGTARADFPGASAQQQYHSIQRLLALPDNTRIFVGHDYPPNGREPMAFATVAMHKKENILINSTVTETDYIRTRTNKDQGKAVPHLLLPALQVNMRAGTFGRFEENQLQYIKIPVNKI